MRSETYNFQAIEAKWQKEWDKKSRFIVSNPDSNHQETSKKFYCLVMFPYPSGKIHMGHARNYCIGDVVARYKKMKGHTVLHPIGWDAFGLPAENAAIERGINPGEWTRKNISDMREDIKLLGISYDWSREFATCDPDYYRWNQWFFVQMFKKGLAYKRKSSVNWCPHCQTVLANEQVHEGSCWRCHSSVDQKELEQWFLKITDYAEELLEDLKLLEGKWPDEVISMQRNWIGKSVGAEVDFKLDIPELNGKFPFIRVFTTRPDTLFGATFLVLSPEHPIVAEMVRLSNKKELSDYCEQARKKTKIERTSVDREKTGVFTGFYSINPVNNSKVPIWIADYVLSDYGTGAIMAVPAHDSRDFAFAKRFGLPIIEVIHSEDAKRNGDATLSEAYEGEGTLIHSGELDGLNAEDAKKKIVGILEKRNQGKASITFRIRDWLISRQRYWGTPIPIVKCPDCGHVPVREESLPVLLPDNVQFTGKGESPLSQIKDFVNVQCPQCGKNAFRETDTMDTFVDSSWYFLRYCDPKNSKVPFDSEAADHWMPVDQYIGGIEHACMHLVYSRFFHKVIRDLGLVKSDEPFERLLTQGMVTLGGSAMSKSKGNIVAVQDMASRFGADTARLFVLFASPPKSQLEWSEDGVQGSWRFLNRIWRLGNRIADASNGTVPSADKKALETLDRKTHQTIKKVDEDIERDFQFNTAIAALMELLNTLSDYPAIGDALSRESFRTLVLLLFPFAPHLSSEIWAELHYQPETIDNVPFPSYDPKKIVEQSVEIVLQVNGKMRGKIVVGREESDNEDLVLSKALESFQGKPSEAEITASISQKKYKFVKGRLVNFVA